MEKTLCAGGHGLSQAAFGAGGGCAHVFDVSVHQGGRCKLVDVDSPNLIQVAVHRRLFNFFRRKPGVDLSILQGGNICLGLFRAAARIPHVLSADFAFDTAPHHPIFPVVAEAFDHEVSNLSLASVESGEVGGRWWQFYMVSVCFCNA